MNTRYPSIEIRNSGFLYRLMKLPYHVVVTDVDDREGSSIRHADQLAFGRIECKGESDVKAAIRELQKSIKWHHKLYVLDRTGNFSYLSET